MFVIHTLLLNSGTPSVEPQGRLAHCVRENFVRCQPVRTMQKKHTKFDNFAITLCFSVTSSQSVINLYSVVRLYHYNLHNAMLPLILPVQCQGGQKTSDKVVTEKPNSDGLTEKMDRMDGEMPTKKKKHKEHEGAVNSTVKLDSQESVHLTEVNSDETEVPKKKRKKKHKEHTEVVTDSSQKLDCDESLMKVNREEGEMVAKEKKRKHKKCPEVTEATEVQDSDNHGMESFVEVNRDEVERPRKKKHQPTEDTASTSINSSASGVDHELDDVGDMPKQKKRKQQDLEQNGKNIDPPPSEELNNCDSPVKTKRKKKQRHGLEGSGLKVKKLSERDGSLILTMMKKLYQ